jgi:hypothetical protein
MMPAVDENEEEDALALFDFHKSGVDVHGLVESGVTTMPQLFLTPTASISSAATYALVSPYVDLTIARSHIAALAGAAARSYGLFQVTKLWHLGQ